MMFKILGALFIVVGCGSFGLIMAFNHRREVFALEQLIAALDYMQSELRYNLLPLPELSEKVVGITKGVVSKVFRYFLEELQKQVLPDAEICMRSALEQARDVPDITKSCFEVLSLTLGKFDLEGQERALSSLRQNCYKKLDEFTKNQDTRLRSYQTLGICAGAAVTILFI